MFLAISFSLLLSIQGNPEQAKIKKGDTVTSGSKGTFLVSLFSKDDSTTRILPLDESHLSRKKSPFSAIMYSKDPQKRMILFGEELLKIGDRSRFFPELSITDIKPNSVILKYKGREEEVFLEK